MKNNILSALYYLYVTASLIILGLFVFINITESLNQLWGVYTLFNQISQMTENQLLLYCLSFTSILIMEFILLLKYLSQDKKIKAVLTSSFALITIAFMFVIESITLIYI